MRGLVPVTALWVLALTGCEPRWEQAFDAGENWYQNLGGATPDLLYAVGGTTDKGSIQRFDGKRWAQVEFGVDVPLLNWVHAVSKDDVWAVGNEGTLLHFDGAAWTLSPAQTTQPLWGIWGAASDDLWAVGGSGFSSGEPLLFHFDGTAWTKIQVPPLSRDNVFAFYKVWGTSATDVRVVGQDGAIIHFDGAGWKDEVSGAKDDLISLWGNGPNHIVAVGGRGNGLVSIWDGAAWTTTSLSPLPGLNGVWMDADGTTWVGGGMGTLGELDVEQVELLPAEVDSTLDFHSVFGSGERLYAVGGNLATGASTGRFKGVAVHRAR